MTFTDPILSYQSKKVVDQRLFPGAGNILNKYLAYQVRVDTLTGKRIYVTCDRRHMLVRDLKKRITAIEGIPVDQQRLVFQGKEIGPLWSKLAFHGIGSDSQLHLILRLRGPARTKQTVMLGTFLFTSNHKTSVFFD